MASLLKYLPAMGTVIIVSTLFSIIGFIASIFNPVFFEIFALKPANIFSVIGVVSLVTHMFLHGNFFHLLVNMLSLFFVGGVTERIIGRKRFLWFYLIAGIFAGLVFVASAYFGTKTGFTSVFGSIDQAGVGASGALFGLLGILAMIIPRKRVFLIVGPIVFLLLDVIVSSHLPSGWSTVFSVLMNILIFLSLFAFFTRGKLSKIAMPVSLPLWAAPFVAILPLVLVSFYVEMPIANSAHFGGLVAGLVYGLYLRMKYRKKIALVERYIR